MAAANAQSIAALLQKSSLEDHEEILKACDATLQKSKSDTLAQHVRAVSLLKLDRFDEALHLFESTGKSLQEQAPLEYAYSLYKGGSPKAAAEAAARLRDRRGARHVEAQALYRAENFTASAGLYDGLSSTDSSLEQSDLRINRGAVEAQLIWSGQHATDGYRKPGREDLEAFEPAYNAACASIARGELRQAEVLLKRAKDLCKYSEELSDDEKTAELLPISVQQLYILECLGKSDEAQAIASEIKADEVSDMASREIAHHNLLIAQSQPSNPFMAFKALKHTTNYNPGDKPFLFQQWIINANSSLMDLWAFKHDGVARSTAKLLKSQSSSPTSADSTSTGVLNATAHAKGEKSKAALKHLLPELERSPFNVGLLLTIIQIYISMNNPTSATNLLESFFTRLEQSSLDSKESVRFSPGLVAVAVTLYRSQNRRTRATRELDQAASYWRQTSNPSKPLLTSAGVALLESSDPKDISTAGEIFTGLHETYPEDRIAAAGFVAAYAGKDHSKVSAEIEQLTPISQLVQGIDVDELENAGIPQSSNALAIAQKTASKKRGAADQGSNKPKRIRKSRLPKDYDPSKTPDPERWLPLRDRSTYRPKGKKGKRKDADRTQGGLVADEVGVKNTASPARPTMVGAAGGGNKKKKKGKK